MKCGLVRGKGQTSGAWQNGVVVSDSEIRVRELGRIVRD